MRHCSTALCSTSLWGRLLTRLLTGGRLVICPLPIVKAPARILLALLLCFTLQAAKKPQPIQDGVGSNNDASIKATVYADPASVQELLGDSLGGHYIVIKLDVSPNKLFKIDHDNFLLRTDKDGERAHVYEPTQIAGDGSLVVTTTEDLDKDKKKGSSGIMLGGMGGGMGSSPGMVGTPKPVSATMKESTGEKNPILKTLETRMLPQKEVEQSTSGLLYFPMEKQKVKDLELIITTPSGKLNIRFTK
jgi:hypothetical protein